MMFHVGSVAGEVKFTDVHRNSNRYRSAKRIKTYWGETTPVLLADAVGRARRTVLQKFLDLKLIIAAGVRIVVNSCK